MRLLLVRAALALGLTAVLLIPAFSGTAAGQSEAERLEAAGIAAGDLPRPVDARAPAERLSAPEHVDSGLALRGPAIVPATLIAQDDQTPAGTPGPITSLNQPATNLLGEVGFTGGLNDGGSTTNFVWYDTGVTWLNTDAMGFTLTGAEGTSGIGPGGAFVYSPSTDGDDSVWTELGLLLVENTQAPGFPMGTTNTFNSRPTMGGNGTAYWVAGFNESGGTSSEGRMLYSSTDRTPATITVLLRSDDMVGGFPIDRPSGVGFDYRLSDDGTQHIHDLLLDTGSTATDGAVYVNGAIVARESLPSGSGDNWDNFDIMSINNAGDYLFTGDTDGATTSDEFIAYNGVIAVREGDVIDGVTLTSSATLRGAAINNLGQAVHGWGISGGTELLFHACDASDLAGTSTLLLSTDDMVDLDNNMTGDATVTDFNGSTISGQTYDLAEDGFFFLEVDLDDGGGDLEAVIRLQLPLCGNPPVIDVSPAMLDSTQEPNQLVVAPLTIGNTGDNNLTWSIAEAPADCTMPGDLPWVSVSPTMGSTVPAGADMVDVSFDSTGLAPGVYTGLLCINSNDPMDPLVSVPLTLTVGAAAVPVEIPTLSTLGLALLVTLLAALSLVLLRRRSAA